MMQINSGLNYEEWVDVYKKVINWEIKIDESQSTEMWDILAMQKSDANAGFSKFVEKNYLDWVNETRDAPTMSHNLMRRKVFTQLDPNAPTIMLLLDNLRYDQWKVIEPIVTEYFPD